MRLRSNACSASGGVYDLSRISPLSLCLATSLGGQTEQREEPRAVARELGAELRTRMPDEGGNQHEISMKSACNQHAINMQSTCNQHAIRVEELARNCARACLLRRP